MFFKTKRKCLEGPDERNRKLTSVHTRANANAPRFKKSANTAGYWRKRLALTMESHAADQGKAAMADLMSIAKWKAPHASIVTWQAGLDEIDRFYRSDISQSTTAPDSTAHDSGTSDEYNAEQAGFNGAQSMLGPAHQDLFSFSPDEMSYPVDYALTTKQNGKSLPQQEQAAEPLPQPASPAHTPAINLHPPHAFTSLDPQNKTSLPNLNQASQSTNIETPPEPFPTQHQPQSEASTSNLLQPPTQLAKKLPLSHAQTTPSLSKAAQRNSTTPLLHQTHAFLPLQQNPQCRRRRLVRSRLLKGREAIRVWRPLGMTCGFRSRCVRNWGRVGRVPRAGQCLEMGRGKDMDGLEGSLLLELRVVEWRVWMWRRG
ncbi:hypothetical protein KC362_g66 [Hortaea werneckii]|nr:hypothetical protein KC362_g66 [Hortaea werneckii]